MAGRFDNTHTGWAIALWTLLTLGGFFYFLGPELPENVPYPLAATLACALWAVGAVGLALRVGKAWLVAGRKAGLQAAEEDRHGIRSYLFPRMEGNRDGRRITLETNRPANSDSFTWTHVTASYQGSDALGTVRLIRSWKKTGQAGKKSSEQAEAMMQQFRTGLQAKEKESGTSPGGLQEALERVEREAGLMSMQGQDVTTGDERFDRRFKITAEQSELARGMFDPHLRSQLQEMGHLDQVTLAKGAVELTVRGRVQSARLVEAMITAAMLLAERAEEAERRAS